MFLMIPIKEQSLKHTHYTSSWVTMSQAFCLISLGIHDYRSPLYTTLKSPLGPLWSPDLFAFFEGTRSV